MSVLDRFRRSEPETSSASDLLGSEVRSIGVEEVFGEDWFESMNSVMSVAGEKALQLHPVYAATSLIADQYAALPIDFFEKKLGFSIPKERPEWFVNPDPRISLYDWKHQMITSLLLRGNAYGQIIRGVFGEIQNIVWVPPHKVRVDELSGFLPVYKIAGDTRNHLNIRAGGDILHIAAYVLAGSCVGLSPVTLFRRQFEMSRSALMTGHKFYDKRAIPAGILKTDTQTLDPVKTDEAKAVFLKSVEGGVVAFDKNWTWQQVSLDPADSQFLETIKATASQIAAIFRVEPDDIGGDATGSLKYTTVEGNQRKFNIRTLLSWTVRIEYAVDESVLGPNGFLKHNLDALARPNLYELVRSISEELRNGTLTLAEARSLRDRVPLTDEQIQQWQVWYVTTKSKSESDATSTAIQQLADSIPTGD